MIGTLSADKSDESLVLAARSGQSHALDELVNRYFGLVYAIALARLNDREQAEELTQEVFLRVCLLIDRLRDPALFSHWISRITRNLAIDWQRRGSRASRLLPMVSMHDVPEDIEDRASSSPRDEAAEKEDASALQEVLARLRPEERELVLLHYMEGLSQGDIAKRLGVDKSTVSRHLDRSLQRMQGLLDQVLRQMASRLRPRTALRARVLMITAAAVTLPAATKSAMAATAAAALQSGTAETMATGASAGSGVMSLIHAALLFFKSGGTAVGIGKGIGLVALAGVIGTGVYYATNGEGGASTPTAAVASAPSAPGTSELFDFKPVPKGDKKLVMRTEVEMTNTVETPQGAPADLAKEANSKVRQVLDMSLTTRREPGGMAMEFETLSIKVEMEQDGEKVSFDSAKPLPPANQRSQIGNAAASMMRATQAQIGKKVIAHVNAAGKVERFEGMKERVAAASKAVPAAMRVFVQDQLDAKAQSKEMEQLVVPKGFPGGPVRVGDTWTTSETRKLSTMGEMRIDQEYRFAGWEMLDERRVAVIENVGTGSMGKGAQLPKEAQSYQPKWSDFSIWGKTWFDPELGVIGSTSNQKLTMEMTIPVAKQTTPMTMKMHTNTTMKTGLVKVSDVSSEERGAR